MVMKYTSDNGLTAIYSDIGERQCLTLINRMGEKVYRTDKPDIRRFDDLIKFTDLFDKNANK